MKAPTRSLLAAAAALALSGAAHAASQWDFTGPDNGSWGTAANWTFPGVPFFHAVPGISDTAVLGNSATAGTVFFNAAYGVGAGIAQLTLDATARPTIQLNQTVASTLVATDEIIGYSKTGSVYNQTAGTNRANYFFVAELFGSGGTYQLGGTGNVIAQDITVGRGGSGSFAQSAGTVSVSNLLTLGTSTDAVGSYTLSGGNVASTYVEVGFFGAGSFNQTAGQHTVTGFLSVGHGSNGVGTYNLSGGQLTTPSLIVGGVGNGTFNQTGGTVNVNGNLGFNTEPSSSSAIGTYSLSAGTLNVAGAITPGAAQSMLTVDGGTLNAHDIAVNVFKLGSVAGSNGQYTQVDSANNFYNIEVGVLGQGRYLQLGGTTNAASVIVGEKSGGSGSYLLAGGTLSTISTYVGNLTGSGIGVFEQTGGTHSVASALTIAASDAKYTLSNGVLDVKNIYGQGTLNLNGGSLNVRDASSAVEIGTLSLGTFAGSSFALAVAGTAGVNTISSLKAGTLTIGGAGIGSLTQTAGNVTADTLNINGRYTHNGGSLVVNTALNNNGLLQMAGTTLTSKGSFLNSGTLQGSGQIMGSAALVNTGLVRQEGELILATTGANLNNGNWELANGQALQLEGANLTNVGTLNLNGGQISGSGVFANAPAGTLTGRGAISTTFSNAGTLALDGGSTSITKPFTNSGAIQLASITATLSGSTVTNTGLIQGFGKVNSSIVNTGLIQASGGTLTLGAALNNPGTLQADSGATLRFTTGLGTHSGVLRLNGGALDNRGHTLVNSGQILASTGASRFDGALLGQAGSKVIVSGGGSLSFYDTVEIQSGAELRVSTGSSAVFFGNVIQRTGALFNGTGTRYYEAGLSVGGSPGLGLDAGDVQFGAGNTYLAELGGITACTADCANHELVRNASFDRYSVAGHLTLGGTLRLVSWQGFVAQAGQSFDLFDWGTVSGSFDAIDASGLALGDGLAVDTNRLGIDGSIQITAVPEPGTWALLLAGMTLGGWVKRRGSRH
jgi:hypothetical protein